MPTQQLSWKSALAGGKTIAHCLIPEAFRLRTALDPVLQQIRSLAKDRVKLAPAREVLGIPTCTSMYINPWKSVFHRTPPPRRPEWRRTGADLSLWHSLSLPSLPLFYFSLAHTSCWIKSLLLTSAYDLICILVWEEASV